MTARRQVRMEVCLPAQIDALRLVGNLTKRLLVDGAGLLPRDQEFLQIHLAAREACSNVARHAYDGIAPGWLRFRMEVSAEAVVLEVEDDGKPLGRERARLFCRAPVGPDESPSVGGYGLDLIRDTMDSVTYTTGPTGSNRLRMCKRLDLAA